MNLFYIRSSHFLIGSFYRTYICSKNVVHQNHCRNLYLFSIRNFAFNRDYGPDEKAVRLKERIFQKIENPDKRAFLITVDTYCERDKGRRGHVEFIHAALKHMEEYGVEDDLEVYKKLLDIFPKGKYVAQNIFQTEFMHFPKHQQCAIDLLDQMERFGVMPDKEIQDMIYNTFGKYSFVHRKFARMAYWLPKFRNLSPFPLPKPLPNDVSELAKLAIERICVDLRNVISVYNTSDVKESLDKTWIISGQSPEQQKLLREHPLTQPVIVEGPYIIWLRKVSISYFILSADPKPIPEDEVDIDDVSNLTVGIFTPPAKKVAPLPSIHEQEDRVIFACCATGTSSRDSLLSWIRILQKTNPILERLPITFTLKAPSKELVTLNQKETDIASSPALPESTS
ncbi:evolutionarily conserved signaling intermediate in Toll pathway, mitochondrial-like [Centruroides sculpturatus]|uniref:evolutionarily conserved signaling intermediate in Toll pathway, mitochondrial-like n=1 Tax=Centruroides sculpturatus TaxID=218467 RepID=UPI000C6CEE69|nr:evolutionarily conserved signaling intermediate in Toll pathway, mitochondrial-like [Centruroides sculpturatus]XP_023210268.1 evolutionarily conserved signaling intermediate in Toll pathway, mitochondrial-like [Centruroides sculpturatus]XP_023210278.1 evolutionarily conserved signaling intermediate in Toll pathway, mitochondrial-like [Centruroides sculpturatus]